MGNVNTPASGPVRSEHDEHSRHGPTEQYASEHSRLSISAKNEEIVPNRQGHQFTLRYIFRRLSSA